MALITEGSSSKSKALNKKGNADASFRRPSASSAFLLVIRLNRLSGSRSVALINACNELSLWQAAKRVAAIYLSTGLLNFSGGVSNSSMADSSENLSNRMSNRSDMA